MIFRQLFDRESCTYTYLLGDEESGECVLIDPVRELVDRDVQLIAELGLSLKYTLETHVHADHITGSGTLRQRLGSQSVLSARGGADCADHQVSHGDLITVGGLTIEVRETPGHTNTCVSYYVPVASMIFTGDTLFVRGCGRTDFQEGDSATLYRSVHEQILTLPDDTLIYPGHDYKGRTVTTVAEERDHNPRLGGGRSADEFVEIMDGLNLSLPKKLAVAVPANQNCGLPVEGSVSGWAPIVRSSEGVPEITVGWLGEHLGDDLRLIDVREPGELAAELGHVDGSDCVPLDLIGTSCATWDKAAPIVLICRSGKRSGDAAQRLEAAGFMRVASLSGGMIAWNDASLPIAR